jgi:hypothetical protein
MGEVRLGGSVSEGECWMVGAICGRNNRGTGAERSGRLNNEPEHQRDRHCMASFESASRWDVGEDFTPEEWRMAAESRESVSGPGSLPKTPPLESISYSGRLLKSGVL